MNTVEAVQLTRQVAALAPGTRIGADSPVAWALVLDDVSIADALTALRTVYRDHGNDQEYGPRRIEPDDILREVKRIRNQRITNAPPYVPSRNDLTPEQELAELRAYRHAVGNGHQPEQRQAIGPRRTIPVLVHTIKEAR